MKNLELEHDIELVKFKEMIIEELKKKGFEKFIMWDGFKFKGENMGTKVEGEITEKRISLTASGFFESMVINEISKVLTNLLKI